MMSNRAFYVSLACILLAISEVRGATAPLVAKVEVDATRELGPVNRQLFGVCVYETGLTDRAAQACRSFLGGGATRVWVRLNPAWHATYVPFLRAVKPKLVIGFTDKSWHPEKARYVSAKDNNLFGYQLPSHVVKTVRCGLESGVPLTHYALWNEPWHAVNGGWDADDYARYIRDCSRALRAAFPQLKIGAFVHAGRPAWNERFLSRLAPGDVDVLIDHFYFGLRRPDPALGPYGKVGLAARLAGQVREIRQLVDRFGKGRWQFMCTEWNVHPPSYDPPYEPSRDLGAALFQASMLQAFEREGLDAATLFLLNSKRHFSLIGDADAKTRWPTFYVFDMYGRRYRGGRLATRTESPMFAHWLTNEPESRRETPLVEATACRNPEGEIVVMAVNKRAEGPAEITFSFKGFQPRRATSEVLTGESPTTVQARVSTQPVLPPPEGEPWRVTLPAFSFAALRFSAAGAAFGQQLLANPALEVQSGGRPQGWSAVKSGKAEGETQYVAENGNHFLRLSKTNWLGMLAWQQAARIQPGVTVRLQGRARGQGGTAFLIFLAQDGKWLEHHNRRVGAEGWQAFTLDATAPPAATSVRVQLRRQKPPGTTDFDDLSLRAAQGAASSELDVTPPPK